MLLTSPVGHDCRSGKHKTSCADLEHTFPCFSALPKLNRCNLLECPHLNLLTSVCFCNAAALSLLPVLVFSHPRCLSLKDQMWMANLGVVHYPLHHCTRKLRAPSRFNTMNQTVDRCRSCKDINCLWCFVEMCRPLI